MTTTYPVPLIVPGEGWQDLGVLLDGGFVPKNSVVPTYAKVSTVGVAPTVVAPQIDLAMPAFPPADEGTTTKVSTWTWTTTDYESVFGSSDGISPAGYIYASNADLLSVPESMCGNCRRDWHEVPLTETVARMWDSVSFDETYDPATDDSRVVCPGSEHYGPGLSVASGGSNQPGMYTFSIVFSAPEHTTIPTPWGYEAPILTVTLYSTDLKDIDDPTWTPYEEAPKLAGLEAAPKAPVSPGFDFSDFKLGISYQPPKGKKKKK